MKTPFIDIIFLFLYKSPNLFSRKFLIFISNSQVKTTICGIKIFITVKPNDDTILTVYIFQFYIRINLWVNMVGYCFGYVFECCLANLLIDYFTIIFNSKVKNAFPMFIK